MAQTPPKRLQKSASRRVFFGVTGGLAEYLNVDIVLVRVAFVALAFINLTGVVVYILLAFLMPDPTETPASPPASPPPPGPQPTSAASSPLPQQPETDERNTGRFVVGIILIVLGLAFLLQRFHLFWWWQWGVLWPVAIIVLGVALVIGQLRR